MHHLVTKEMVINDVIKRYPKTIAVFNQFKVDSCCGGGQPIEATATRDGVALEPLLEALNRAAQEKT